MSNTVVAKVIRTIRQGHTVYGNPIISVVLDTDPTTPYRISDNASLVYAIENPEFKQQMHVFKLTRAGRISGLDYSYDY